MSDNEIQIVTTVAAQGKAEADYDRASFALSTTKQAKTAPAAKALVELNVAKIRKVIDALEADGLKIDKGSLKSNYSNQPYYEYLKSKAKLMGYQTTYYLTFTTSTLDKVSEVQDELTALKDVQVSDVVFGIKDTEQLKITALGDAFKRVSARFEAECRVLDKNKDDYEIVSWNVQYYDGHGHRGGTRVMAMAAASAGAAPEAMEIESGKSEVNVNLGVSYALRKPRGIPLKSL
jgi:uncharacterized protein YggE